MRRAGAAKPISQSLASVDSAAGRRRTADYLDDQPFPHYEPSAEEAGMLIRIDADGTRTVGRCVNRRFRAEA